MNRKIRLLIAKIKPMHTLARVIMYNSSIFFYKKCKTADMEKHILSLKDSKKGKRCFIIGNGPSLCVQDLEKLKNEDCFAANGIYNIFSQTSWRPKYYIVMDRYFDVAPEVIRDMECDMVFLGDYYWRFHDVLREDAICLHQHVPLNPSRLPISRDIEKNVTNTYTVSFVAMQIAAYLGYREIYLLGFDHAYGLEFDKDGRLVEKEGNVAHFYQDKHPERITANVIEMTRAYVAFREFALAHGIAVKNATRGGKLEVFERVDFDSLSEN